MLYIHVFQDTSKWLALLIEMVDCSTMAGTGAWWE